MITLALAAALAVAEPATPPPVPQIFPVLPVPPVDPARVPPARLLAEKVVPSGTYRKLMNGTIRTMMDGLFGHMLDVPAKQLVKSFGLTDQDTSKLKSGTLREIMAIVDPAYEQRMKITTGALFDGLGDIYAKLEPEIREGLAQSYAARFDVSQLNELNTFFSTPTGASFAAQQLTVMTDPAMMNKMQAILPAIMKQMPAFIARMQAETASLPKPKTAADLTDADRAKLAQLLGVAPDKLKAKETAK